MQGGTEAGGLVRAGHGQTRTVLRILGPLLIVAAIALAVVGFTFESEVVNTKGMGEEGWFEERAKNGAIGFALIAGGMMVGFAGMVLTKFGYMGAVARYAASEIAPVGTDTINYVGEKAQPGLTKIGTAIGTGFATARGGSMVLVRCHKCRHENTVGARFCQECGVALAKTRSCPSCAELNDPDARFCDDCGVALT